LDKDLNQTGKTYSTTVASNLGDFEQKQIELTSNYMQLKADGYYFNEVSGKLSTGQLTLYALVDVFDKNSANVNVLTHLEKSRVEYLVQQKGYSFKDAKKQAQTEVLNIFSLSLATDSASESLNLTALGNNNAILLAVSCILQGCLSTADMSELMANIISDIRTDGKLDDAALGSELIDNARLISLDNVRLNLQNKYNSMGVSNIVIPDFEKYVTDFKTKTTYIPVKQITYPVSGSNGLNLLNDTVKTFATNKGYSMKANLPDGTSLRVVIKGKKNSWGFAVLPAPQNWTINTYDNTLSGQEFIVTESNKTNDMYLSFNELSDTLTIETYENNALTPTKIKKISREGIVPPFVSSGISYPEMGIFVGYYNLLNDVVSQTLGGKVYAMSAYVDFGKALKVIFKGSSSNGWVINAYNNPPLGWVAGTFNSTTFSQEFKTTFNKSDMAIVFPSGEKVTVEIYENNATTPTKIKYLN
jgi:hypothetical protein